MKLVMILVKSQSPFSGRSDSDAVRLGGDVGVKDRSQSPFSGRSDSDTTTRAMPRGMARVTKPF